MHPRDRFCHQIQDTSNLCNRLDPRGRSGHQDHHGGTGLFEDAARARQTESKLLEQHGHLCAAVYLSGYVVECKLKSLLSKLGRPYPRSGAAGHDLRTLWNAAGLRPQDLTGHRRVFLDTWSTSLRYSAELPSGSSAEDLLTGARDLAAQVNVRIRYARPRGGMRR